METITNLVDGLDTQSVALMSFETVFGAWLMFGKRRVSPFVARKMCHAVSGLVMMLVNTDCQLCRGFVYLAASVSLVMNWGIFPRLLPNFWFGTARDVGITIYLLLVIVWVQLGHSLRILAPVFLADPAGAIVGKWLTAHFPKDNPKWIGSKTVGGSFAVFLVTFLTLLRPEGVLERVAVAAVAMLGEAVGGAYDNLVIAMVVIAASGVVPISPFAFPIK